MQYEEILDVNKNIVVAAPAGSGKTEKLARRYIALLISGVSPERILAITFTEKAAAEMKERILKLLREERAELYKSIKEKVFLMRIQTIHSFCLSLIRRFAFELKIAPNFNIMEPSEGNIIEEVIDSALTELMKEKDSKIRKYILDLSTKRGWNQLKKLIKTMFYLRPSSLMISFNHPDSLKIEILKKEIIPVSKECGTYEVFKNIFEEKDIEKIYDGLNSLKSMFLRDNLTVRKKKPVLHFNEMMFEFYREVSRVISDLEIKKIYEVFLYCVNKYELIKRELNFLDFNDLEYLTHELLTKNTEIDNILFAFDEQTDHILVDEFQDTNFLQWDIIKKLTEEWRAGLGSKRDTGINPTLFIVGDKKQSIYGFRNANVEVFDTATKEMQRWYGNLFKEVKVKENYRCSNSIVEFVNKTFSKIMIRNKEEPYWRTEYEEFIANRGTEGKYEVIFVEKQKDDSIQEVKIKEAENVAKRIKEIISKKIIYEKQKDTEILRECTFKDIAILLRKRTHLKEYEDVLRKHNVPFVVVKGLGFHQEPEIVILRSLLFFLIEPSDDYSLYVLLKSPLFNINEDEICTFTAKEGLNLFSKIREDKRFSVINETLNKRNTKVLNQLIEEFLVKTNGWQVFWEPQREANIKKFIQIVQDFEKQGKCLQDIRAYFEIKINSEEESKANLNTEEMNVVKIMTVHTAKGLEFPVVFFVGIEEKPGVPYNEKIKLKEQEGSVKLFYYPDSRLRKEENEFKEFIAKEEEEEKRIFYVALTRARDLLVLSGVKGARLEGLWKYLEGTDA